MGTWFGLTAPRSHGSLPTQSGETRSVATGLVVVSGSQLLPGLRRPREVEQRHAVTRGRCSITHLILADLALGAERGDRGIDIAC